MRPARPSSHSAKALVLRNSPSPPSSGLSQVSGRYDGITHWARRARCQGAELPRSRGLPFVGLLTIAARTI
eukprot:12838873-Alexandrium_andersonii.AAC.1